MKMSRRSALGVAAVGVLSACGATSKPGREQTAVATTTGGGFYQQRDYESNDYHTYLRDGEWLRGPDPGVLTDGEYICFAGASQVFGPYAPKPFPAKITSRTGLPSLNAGVGGAGPAFFLDASRLSWINRSRFCVLQIMSGRSASNHLMQQTDGGRRVIYDGQSLPAEDAWGLALDVLSVAEFWALIDETRANWVADYRELAASVTVPTVIFYISTKPPITFEDRSVKPSKKDLFDGFPPMVTQNMVTAVGQMGDKYAESVTGVGLPQNIYSRFTGEFIKRNKYYPSPEMHGAAATVLTPICKEMWNVGP